MFPNGISGVGARMSTAVINNAMATNPTTGRIFVVGAAALPLISEVKAIYGATYPDGTPMVYTTLALASASCVAARGDFIIVVPGHTETFSSSTAITLSASGVSVVGLGAGSLRPTFTLDTATTSTINVTAANISIKNCIFIANFASIVAPFTLTTAKDFAILGCEFRDTSAVLNFTNIVSTSATSNAADGLRIEDSRRIGAGADSNTTIINMLGTNDRLYVKRNYFTHQAVTGGGGMIIATGKVVTNMEMFDNVFNLLGATGLTTGLLITTNGSTNSGILKGNFDFNLDATTEILVTAGSGFVFFNNYHSGAADKSGYLLPAADA